MDSPQTIDLEKEKKLILKEYRSLLRSLKKNISTQKKRMVRRAFEMAMDSHKDMRRKSGEPYVLHPISVAKVVSEEMGLDASCYFETGNIEQLADRLQEIIDGDFKQVHYDMEKYGWDGIALRVADVYENLKK